MYSDEVYTTIVNRKRFIDELHKPQPNWIWPNVCNVGCEMEIAVRIGIISERTISALAAALGISLDGMYRIFFSHMPRIIWRNSLPWYKRLFIDPYGPVKPFHIAYALEQLL